MNNTIFEAQAYGSTIRRTVGQLVLWTLVVCAALGMADRFSAVPGFLFGALVSTGYFLLLAYRVRRSADLPPPQAVAHMRSGWALRLIFITMMLVVSTRVNWIEFWPAVAGLFSLQCVILFNAVRYVAQRRK